MQFAQEFFLFILSEPTSPSPYRKIRTRAQGFTLVEMMISVAILTMISTATVLSLQTSRYREELNVAARVLSADIRNVQAQALAARNILTCETATGIKKVCETGNTSAIACVGACTPLPPSHVGVFIEINHVSYALFADVTDNNWRNTAATEDFMIRSLNLQGGNHVTISAVDTELGPQPSLNIAIGRQNGVMRLDACGDSDLPPCNSVEPQIAHITLRHSISNDILKIEVNALTGRVSIE